MYRVIVVNPVDVMGKPVGQDQGGGVPAEEVLAVLDIFIGSDFCGPLFTI